MAGRKQKKEALARALAADPGEALALLGGESPRRAAQLLLSFLADPDPTLKYAAAEALGRRVAADAAADAEQGREVMRRLVWSLNEESGAVPFGAPEAMGAIMAHAPVLAAEFASILLSQIGRAHV